MQIWWQRYFILILKIAFTWEHTVQQNMCLTPCSVFQSCAEGDEEEDEEGKEKTFEVPLISQCDSSAFHLRCRLTFRCFAHPVIIFNHYDLKCLLRVPQLTGALWSFVVNKPSVCLHSAFLTRTHCVYLCVSVKNLNKFETYIVYINVKNLVCRNSALNSLKRLDPFYIFCWAVYLNYVKCSDPEKSVCLSYSTQEKEMEKQKMLYQQARLHDRGAAEMVLQMISASKGKKTHNHLSTLR